MIDLYFISPFLKLVFHKIHSITRFKPTLHSPDSLFFYFLDNRFIYFFIGLMSFFFYIFKIHFLWFASCDDLKFGISDRWRTATHTHTHTTVALNFKRNTIDDYNSTNWTAF